MRPLWGQDERGCVYPQVDRQEARPRCGYYFVRPLWGLFFNLAVERTHEPCVPTYRLDVIGIWCFFFWGGVLDVLGELDASLSRFLALWVSGCNNAVSPY